MCGTGRTLPILCNQENFVLRGNSYQIKKCLPNAHVIIKKAVKDCHDNGRPKNGMFIAVPCQLKEFVTDISPIHWRVQAMILHTNGNNIMIINTYFPTDPRVSEFDSSELFTTLSTIQELVNRNDYNSIVWTGDINADFCRKSKFTGYIGAFAADNNFSLSWNKFPVDFTHIQEIDGKSSSSVIDHFLWSQNIDDLVVDAGVLHLVSNFSDHCPIYCCIEVDKMGQEPAHLVKQSPKPSWIIPEESWEKFLNGLETDLKELKVAEITSSDVAMFTVEIIYTHPRAMIS